MAASGSQTPDKPVFMFGEMSLQDEIDAIQAIKDSATALGLHLGAWGRDEVVDQGFCITYFRKVTRPLLNMADRATVCAIANAANRAGKVKDQLSLDLDDFVSLCRWVTTEEGRAAQEEVAFKAKLLKRAPKGASLKSAAKLAIFEAMCADYRQAIKRVQFQHEERIADLRREIRDAETRKAVEAQRLKTEFLQRLDKVSLEAYAFPL